MTKIRILSVVIFFAPLLASAAGEFLYNRDGFSFPNYTNKYNPVNLTPANVERLCGHISCARGTGNSCVLRAPMRTLMQKYNNIMDNGHCEGFAAVSESVFTNKMSIKKLDNKAKSTFSLKLTPQVQSEIAYWFSTQFTNPTHVSKRYGLLPNEVLGILRNPGNEIYSMQMFNPKKPKSLVNEGHTVTPFMVIDQNNQKSKIAIYDSNFPNQTRLISVDRATNSWSYDGFPAMKPERKFMVLVPLSARLKQQNCPEAGLVTQPTPVKPKPAPVKPKTQLWPKGTQPQWVEEEPYEEEEYFEYQKPNQWNLQIDNNGFRFDFEDVVDLIEAFFGGSMKEIQIPDTSASSIYQVDPGQDRRFHLLAKNLNVTQPSNFYVTSRGHAMAIEGIKPYKGQKDEVVLAKDGETISYSTDYPEPITLTVAESLKDADYEIKIKPTAKAGGFDVRVHNSLDTRYGFHELEVELTNHDKSPASYAIEMTRIGPVSDEKFTHKQIKDLTVLPGEKDRIEYGQWHNKESLTVVDTVAGQMEKSIQLSDEE